MKTFRTETKALFMLAVAALCCGVSLADAAPRGDAVEVAPHFDYLTLGSVQPRGWILRQMKGDLESGFTGHLDKLTRHASNDLFLNHTVKLGGPGGWWDSETRGNWLDGYLRMAFLTENRTAVQRMVAYLDRIVDAQEEDGYIGIYQPHIRFTSQHGDNGELWGQGRILLCLLACHEFTGQSKYLDAAERAVQLTMTKYGPQKPYWSDDSGLRGGVWHGLAYIDVLEWLYRITGKKEYRDFALWCYEDFSKANLKYDNQLRQLLNMQIPYHGHGAHVTECARVPIFAYYATGDRNLRFASQNAMQKLQRHITVSGALISDESVRARLPLPTVAYEYCTMLELLTTLGSALQKTGRSGYGDMIERLAFNAAQGARLPNGKAISYTTTDNRFEARRQTSGDSMRPARRKYSCTHEDVAVCCNPNAGKFMPYFVQRMWMRVNDKKNPGLAALAYGPSRVVTTVSGAKVAIDEVTDYPFSETVAFHVHSERPVSFSLHLRNPEWASDASIEAPGAKISQKDGYHVLVKQWQEGDRVAVTFPAEVKPILAANGDWAIQRGPLLYALPLQHKLIETKDYPIEGFHDYDVVLQTPDVEHKSYILDLEAQGFSLQCNASADMLNPWASTPVALKGRDVLLVPLGCTVLRKCTFPAPVHLPKGKNLALNKPVVRHSSQHDPAWKPGNLTDGIVDATSRGWASQGGSMWSERDEWVVIDLQDSHDLTCMVLQAEYAHPKLNVPHRNVREYELWGSLTGDFDGEEFLLSHGIVPALAAEEKWAEHFPSRKTRFVKLRCKSSYDKHVVVGELGLFATGSFDSLPDAK